MTPKPPRRKRRGIPRIAKCACGSMCANTEWNGYFRSYLVYHFRCWRGPWRSSRAAAIRAWNRVMGAGKP